jgi:hypothetical protein
MPDRVRPALTAEEWQHLSADYEGCAVRIEDDILIMSNGGECAVPPELRHAVAALALHGQPYGPQRHWLEQLERAGSGELLAADIAREVCAFLAALLPPE